MTNEWGLCVPVFNFHVAFTLYLNLLSCICHFLFYASALSVFACRLRCMGIQHTLLQSMHWEDWLKPCKWKSGHTTSVSVSPSLLTQVGTGNCRYILHTWYRFSHTCNDYMSLLLWQRVLWSCSHIIVYVTLLTAIWLFSLVLLKVQFNPAEEYPRIITFWTMVVCFAMKKLTNCYLFKDVAMSLYDIMNLSTQATVISIGSFSPLALKFWFS